MTSAEPREQGAAPVSSRQTSAAAGPVLGCVSVAPPAVSGSSWRPGPAGWPPGPQLLRR